MAKRKRSKKTVRRKKVIRRVKKLTPRQRYLVSGPWETFSKKDLREMSNLLVSKYLGSKKKGRTIKKIPIGVAEGVKSYRWR